MAPSKFAASMLVVFIVGAPFQLGAADDPIAQDKARELPKRMRAPDREARRTLDAAVACSTTVREMIGALEISDLIVIVEARDLGNNTVGQLRMLDAAGSLRYIRIALKIPSSMRDRISVLGHELQHALEIAAAPEVRDAATRRSLYDRIGYQRRDEGYFETDAALKAGRRVAMEVSHCRVPR